MSEHRRARLIGYGVLAAIIALVVTAIAIGGHGSSESAGGSGAASTLAGRPAGEPNPSAVAAAPGTASATGSVGRSASSDADASLQTGVDAVTATSVVKTGSLDLQVARGHVEATVSNLITLTTSLGGYVSQSRTDTAGGSPSGELTIRVPEARFDDAVNGASHLGRVLSLTTSAHDVTGKVVDLGARAAALERTRSTYLTILGRARTIGATLEVQQQIENVQQQIEEIQGELKVLRNQSADGTLTVSVEQRGTVVVAPHHHSGGIGKAWHHSVSRFTSGFDAIVGALGPLVLAILVLSVLAGIGALGYRGVRRATS